MVIYYLIVFKYFLYELYVTNLVFTIRVKKI